MSSRAKGRHVALSLGRKLAIELLHHAKQVPSIPVARTMNVKAVVQARSNASPAPSWTTIFARTFALVAQEYSELRRTLIRYPWPHLYEHPYSVASVVIEREIDGEPTLLSAKIRSPERQSLAQIEGHIRYFKEAPLEKISQFRRLLRIGHYPGILRRFIIWETLNFAGKTRAKRCGTYMVSSYGSLGAEQIHPISPITTLLTFGPIQPDGEVVVKFVYDHRVMDGRYIAKALAHTEQVLQTTIVQELQGMEKRQCA